MSDTTEPRLAVCNWITSGPGSSANLAPIAAWLSKNMPEAKVLDAGCGNGELLRLLLANHWVPERLRGCDIEPGHVHLSMERTGLANMACGDFCEEVPWPGWADAVVAIGWIHDDWKANDSLALPRAEREDDRIPEKALDGAADSLSPGGVFICDWRAKSGGSAFLSLAEARGWKIRDIIESPTTYPTWVLSRDA